MQKMRKPILRILASPVRSGSTAFLHSLSQHPQVETATFLMKKNIFYDSNASNIDYTIYGMLSIKKYLVYKATFGYKTKLESTYDLFRDMEDVLNSKPLFLFRNPIDTYNSWKYLSWGNLETFSLAYQHVKSLLDFSLKTNIDIKCITYEQISQNPKAYFRKILKYWGIPYKESVVNWSEPFGNNTVNFSADSNREMQIRFLKDIGEGIYDSIRYGKQTYSYVKRPIILDQIEEEFIKKNLFHIYNEVQESTETLWKI
jgi:hypothetical protein